ncbi:MAG: hypothetical protein KDB79_02655 [Acidobacteria bacterium]|nr:hypothetical protein [Acidobacteriota bacterium]
MTILIDELREKLPENTRHFVDFPEVIFFDQFHDHVENLDGTEITEFEMDGVFEMWLEFTFRGNKFYVNNRLGDYWFFVEDPKCPEPILLEIADHFRKLLEKDESATEITENTEGWEM